MNRNVLKTVTRLVCVFFECLLTASVLIYLNVFSGFTAVAAIPETMILLGEDSGDYNIELFQNEYVDKAGNIVAKSGDGSRILAPGTSGEHMIHLKNGNDFTVDYEIDVETSVKNAPGSKLPIYVRVTAGYESLKRWSEITDRVSDTLKGTLEPGREIGFYYRWRWDDSDSGSDTELARDYPDMTLQVVVSAAATESVSEFSDDSDSSDFSHSSGRRDKNSAGRETFENEVGWINIPEVGDWYYSDARIDSTVETTYTGWLYENRDGRWYYLDPRTGKMRSGWCKIDGYWYYFTKREDADDHGWYAVDTKDGHIRWNYRGNGGHSYGAMYTNEYTPDGYFVDSEGRWVEGG